MDSIWLYLIIGLILIGTGAFLWLIFTIKSLSAGPKKSPHDDYIKDAKAEVERIFSDDFREELRNRGRLHFEKIINENAMFLKQDLQLTASQLNEYMQDSIKKVLKEEFSKYEQSIENAKQIAIESIEKTQQLLEQQRAAMEQELAQEVQMEKQRIIKKFEENMNQIVSYYLLDAVGNEIDLSDQLDYIFRQLEDNKQAIIEDIRSGS